MHWQNYINGEWVDGSDGSVIEIENPATGEQLGTIARATAPDVDRAVEAARAAVRNRSIVDLRPGDRGRLLLEMSVWLRDHRDEIIEWLTLDSGKSLLEAGWEADTGARYLEYYGGLTDKVEGRYVPLGAGYTDYVVPTPYGVSAHIIPWNYPVDITARGFGPAFAAGNAVVIKSPELDPITVTYFAKAADAVGLPPGAINVICGYGHDAGAALAAHEDIDQVTFTGSVATGQSVLHSAADAVIPAVVELGGKSAGIVLDDADLDDLTDQTRWAIFSNAGQVCSAMSRLLVPERMHDEVVDRLVTMATDIDVGPGMDGGEMGPLISGPQLDRVTRYTRIGTEDGATAVVGGERVDRPGHFFQPTIFTGVTNDMTIAQEEIFGPVLSVLTYDGIEQAVDIANDSEYGLVAGIYGNDLDKATWAADRLEAGQVFVNEWFAGGIETPFGGFKNSGFGREKGQSAIENYFQWKAVAIKRS